MLVNHNIIDYMVKSCVDTYNLGEARLIKQNLEEKKVQFAFKRADLKLSVEFANDKISSIIYNSFLTDQQRENVTEQEFTTKMNDMLAVKTVESVEEIEKMSNEIIKSVNFSKLFGGKIKELLLNGEDREKLFKIKKFFGTEQQLLKLYEEIEELQTAYRNYRKSFYKKDENLIEEIADCFVIALQINKVKMVKNMIRGMVDNSSVFKTEMIEKIIRMVKFKINRTVDRIEKGEYGVYKIEYKANRGTEQPENSKEKEEQKTGNMTKSEKEKLKKEQKIYEFIKNKSPYYYQARDIQLNTNIKAKECTEIIEKMITEGKITVVKKGKDRIYGATLSTSENIQEAEVVS